MFSTINTCNDPIIENIILLTSYFLRLRFVINKENLQTRKVPLILSLDFFLMINIRWFELIEQPNFFFK